MPNEKAKIEQEIIALIAKIVKRPVERVTLSSDLFNELGVDSLSGMEIFSSLDKKYQLTIPEKELQNVRTVNDLCAVVGRELERKR